MYLFSWSKNTIYLLKQGKYCQNSTIYCGNKLLQNRNKISLNMYFKRTRSGKTIKGDSVDEALKELEATLPSNKFDYQFRDCSLSLYK